MKLSRPFAPGILSVCIGTATTLMPEELTTLRMIGFSASSALALVMLLVQGGKWIRDSAIRALPDEHRPSSFWYENVVCKLDEIVNYLETHIGALDDGTTDKNRLLQILDHCIDLANAQNKKLRGFERLASSGSLHETFPDEVSIARQRFDTAVYTLKEERTSRNLERYIRPEFRGKRLEKILLKFKDLGSCAPT